MGKASLWDAIHRYCIACDGSPGKHVYGNVERQHAVADVETEFDQLTARIAALEAENSRLRAEMAEMLDASHAAPRKAPR